MPPDITKRNKRVSRRATAEEADLSRREHELRRTRGEISCAECTRLKLRCDRMVPCSSCVRRGRSSICPNGISGIGHENRGLFYDSVHLRQKLGEMGNRIQQLEDALEILQKTHSNLPHPLLQKDLLGIKRGFDLSDVAETRESIRDADELDAFGTLTISESGASRFIGRTGAAESLLLTGKDAPIKDSEPSPARPLTIPLPIMQIANAWPFISEDISTDDFLTTIESQLPPWQRASSLCETYLEHISWLIRPVLRDQLFDELLPTIYKRKRSATDVPEMRSPDTATVAAVPDDLALLLMVFALGALADLTLPPYNKEAEQYHQLARATVSFAKVFESPSLAAVQTLLLMGSYSALSGRGSTPDPGWSMIGVACTLARSMGLHRDPARWKLHPKLAERRRNVFWELFMMENFHGLTCGRPASFVLRHSDCQFPADDDQRVGSNGDIALGYWNWKFQYGKEILHPFNDIMSEVGPPMYSEILKLDRKSREVLVTPSHMQIPPGGPNWENDGPKLIMKRFMTTIMRDIMMMYMHRSFFAKALLDHPANPLRSKYSHSFLTAYSSSLSVLRAVRMHYESSPDLISRFWSMWSHAFSATVVVGTVVTRGLNSGLAPTAIIELSLAVELFEKAMLKSNRAKVALPILRRLRDQAYRAYNQYRHGISEKEDTSLHATLSGNCEEELNILSGKTTLLATKDTSKQTSRPQTSSNTPSVGSGPGLSNDFEAVQGTRKPLSTDALQTPADIDYLLMSYLSSHLDAQRAQAARPADDTAHVNHSFSASVSNSQPPFMPSLMPSMSEQSGQSHMFYPPFEVPSVSSYDRIVSSHPSSYLSFPVEPIYPSDGDYNIAFPSETPGMDEAWRSLMQESDIPMGL